MLEDIDAIELRFMEGNEVIEYGFNDWNISRG